MNISCRAGGLAPSATLALDDRAKELAASGIDVVNMSVGEPDFPAPSAVQAAAIAKVSSGDVKYTPIAGTPQLRETIARHLTETRETEFSAEEVIVCHGAKHALMNALFALADPGDEVLIPLPAWVSYIEIVRLANGVPVEVAPTTSGGLDLDKLEAAVTPKTRGMIVNSPCNPSGYVMDRAETEALAEFAKRHDLWIVSDEIYRRLVYEGERALSPTEIGAEARARTIIIDGASKAFAMTGYRIGYMAAPAEITRAAIKIQSQMTGAPNSISQAAYQIGLESEPVEVEAMVREFGERRDLLLSEFARLGLETPSPRGAFYAFPNIARYAGARGSSGFCEELLEQEALALVPGVAFGMDEHVRLSYALSKPQLREAIRRLENFLRTR